MDSTAQPQFSLASRGPAARVGLFVAVMLVMSAVAAPLGFAISGRDGIGCVILAAGVCTIAGVAALLLHELFQHPRLLLADVLAGLLLRMGVPLVVCMAVHLQGGPLADAGFGIYVMAFYFGSLLVGTALTLPRSPAPAGRS